MQAIRNLRALNTVINQLSTTRVLKDVAEEADIIIERARALEAEWNTMSTDTMNYLAAILSFCRAENEQGIGGIDIEDGLPIHDPDAMQDLLPMMDDFTGVNVQTVIKLLVARGFRINDRAGEGINLSVVWSGAPDSEEWKRKWESYGWTLHLPPVNSIVQFD